MRHPSQKETASCVDVSSLYHTTRTTVSIERLPQGKDVDSVAILAQGTVVFTTMVSRFSAFAFATPFCLMDPVGFVSNEHSEFEDASPADLFVWMSVPAPALG